MYLPGSQLPQERHFDSVTTVLVSMGESSAHTCTHTHTNTHTPSFWTFPPTLLWTRARKTVTSNNRQNTNRRSQESRRETEQFVLLLASHTHHLHEQFQIPWQFQAGCNDISMVAGYWSWRVNLLINNHVITVCYLVYTKYALPTVMYTGQRVLPDLLYIYSGTLL